MSLPDTLREALGQVIADQRREWRREREVIEAQGRQTIAELRAQIVELQADLREKVDARLAELKDGATGERGEAGPAGPQGERGEQGPQGEAGPLGAAGERGEPGDHGEVGARGEAGPAGPMGERGNIGPVGERGAPGERGTDGKDFDISEIAALRSAIDDMRAVKTDSDLSDREFQRRVDASLAANDAASGAALRPTINVSVPITMPRRGKEVMTVEHDAKGRIKRSIKEEVD